MASNMTADELLTFKAEQMQMLAVLADRVGMALALSPGRGLPILLFSYARALAVGGRCCRRTRRCIRRFSCGVHGGFARTLAGRLGVTTVALTGEAKTVGGAAD
jgi:hypothetical protein